MTVDCIREVYKQIDMPTFDLWQVLDQWFSNIHGSQTFMGHGSLQKTLNTCGPLLSNKNTQYPGKST